MASMIVDRRDQSGKSAENRRKFLERVRDSIRESMPDMLSKGKLGEIGKNGGEVKIKRRTIEEPNFTFGQGGENEHVLPGNKEYSVGDRIKKGGGGAQGGSGKEGSDQGGGEDAFVVQISREEFLNYLFEDLELPNLARKELAEIKETKPRNAGFTSSGTPSRLAVSRTMKLAHARRIALRASGSSDLRELEALAQARRDAGEPVGEELLAQIEEARRRSKAPPFIDPIDLRYRNQVVQTIPVTHATMVCIMDNSGSMGEREKTLARKFFYLLYMFLERKYEAIELVFIHHTEKAREVSEEEFFNTRESGGTVVSSALSLLAKMMGSRVDPARTNLYVCQCSDGDNFSSDDAQCQRLLREELLGKVQYWAYVQIEGDSWSGLETDSRATGLWNAYKEVGQSAPHLAMTRVARDPDIYPVFRKLFEKQGQQQG